MAKLQAVEEHEVPDPPTVRVAIPKQTAEQRVAGQMLLLAFRAMSQKFVVALADLRGLMTVVSVFFLFYVAIDDMTFYKIVGLSIYASFILLINLTWRKRHEVA